MKPASWLRERPEDERLLVIDPGAGRFDDARISELGRWFSAGDLLVVNDAATLPASLAATTARGEALELRLMAHASDGSWRALAFGEGDWRTRTEQRAPPPGLAAGQRLTLSSELACEVVAVEDRSLVVRFDREGASLWRALYAHGRPIQYAHVTRDFELWHVQSRFASRPWAFEMPSAGRLLSWELVDRLLGAGVRVARVTHAAGISSTGSAALDRRLPVAERSEVPPETVTAIAAARRSGGAVIAVGTTVVRALESRAAKGALRPGVDDATLVIGPGFVPRVVDGILSGMHPAGTSHFAVLEAFAPRPLLRRALRHAARAGYLEHELGDSTLVLPTR